MRMRNESFQNKYKHLKLAGMIVALAAVLWLSGVRLRAQELPDSLVHPAIMSERADKSLLTSVTTAGTRLVAVGERGIVLLSDDNGMTWRQTGAPVSVTLTAVQFVTPQTGWAVGHCGVVLRSDDGGETWEKQLDGKEAAQLVLESVENEGVRNKEQCIPGNAGALKERLAAARWLVKEGPNKPFLSLYFKNENSGFIIGAYNLIFRTKDGGKSWEPWMQHVENPLELHLYDIQAVGNDLYMVGEQGLLLRSSDGGETFTALSSPYSGTFFGCVSPEGDRVFVFGLLGNAFLSADRGVTWQRAETGVSASLRAGTKLRDGTLILVTLNGTVLTSASNSPTVLRPIIRLFVPFAGVAEASDGNLILVGAQGVKRLPSAGLNPMKGAESDG